LSLRDDRAVTQIPVLPCDLKMLEDRIRAVRNSTANWTSAASHHVQDLEKRDAHGDEAVRLFDIAANNAASLERSLADLQEALAITRRLAAYAEGLALPRPN